MDEKDRQALLAARSATKDAQRRVLMLRREESRLLVAAVSCPLCKAEKGSPCVKPSGPVRNPHSERIREAGIW